MASEDASLPPTFHRAEHSGKCPPFKPASCPWSLHRGGTVEEGLPVSRVSALWAAWCQVVLWLEGQESSRKGVGIGLQKRETPRKRSWGTLLESWVSLPSGARSTLLLSEPQLLFAPFASLCFPHNQPISHPWTDSDHATLWDVLCILDRI